MAAGSGGFNPKLITTSDGVAGEASVLASEHGIHKRAGITLDASLLTADGDGNKIIPAGTVLGKVTSTGKYGLYDNNADDGRETAVGLTWKSYNLKDGDVICDLVLHGSFIEARTSGLDSNAKADLVGRIIFQ